MSEPLVGDRRLRPDPAASGDAAGTPQTPTGAAAETATQTPTPTPPDAIEPPSPLRVLALQRKVVGVAVVLMVACFWVIGFAGHWGTATVTAVGVLLALVNHLVGEYWLGKVISSGAQPTRASMASSAFTRLAVLTVVAVGVAVLTWPDGIGLLLGLAIFRLIALVMTTIPLLKELKAE